jgi:hypothetical protein
VDAGPADAATTESTRPRQSAQGDDQMNEYDTDLCANRREPAVQYWPYL